MMRGRTRFDVLASKQFAAAAMPDGAPEERRRALTKVLIKRAQIGSTASSVLPRCVTTYQSDWTISGGPQTKASPCSGLRSTDE